MSKLTRVKRIDDFHAQMSEIFFVTGGDREPVETRSCGDHGRHTTSDLVDPPSCVPSRETNDRPRTTCSTSPLTRRPTLQSLVPWMHLVSSCAQFLPGAAERNRRETNLFISQTQEPGQNGTVKLRFVNLGDYICVQPIPRHVNSIRGFRFKFLRRRMRSMMREL